MSWKQHENISKVIFSPDSRLIVTESTRNDEPVTVRNTLTGEISCAWARSYRVGTNVAPNGRWLFIDTAGRHNEHLRDITNCNYIRYIDLDIRTFYDASFSKDGRLLAGTAHPRRPIFNRYRWVYIYDLEDNQILKRVAHRSSNPFGMPDDKFHFFSDGETVLLWLEVRKTVRNRSGEKRTYDRRVLMQNVITEEIHREIFFRSGHYQLALHPDESHIAIFDRESMRFRLEELHPFKKLVEWPALEVARAMEFHPTGKWLMTVSYNGKVVVYDSATQDPILEFRIASQKVKSDGLKFAPNRESFAISTNEGFVALYPFSMVEDA